MAELIKNEFIKKVFKIRTKVKVEPEAKNVLKKELKIETVTDNKIENAEVKQMKTFVPSQYQIDIYEFVRLQSSLILQGKKPKNLMVIAGAGCAKTTTSVNSVKFIPGTLNVGFFAFNKDIVVTLENKVPKNCRVQTFHSAGYGALRYRFKSVKVDDKKMYSIFMNLMDSEYRRLSQEESGALMSPFLKLCGLVKNTMLEPTDVNLEDLADKYSVDIEDADRILNMMV